MIQIHRMLLLILFIYARNLPTDLHSNTSYVAINLSEDNLTKEEQSYSNTSYVAINLALFI